VYNPRMLLARRFALIVLVLISDVRIGWTTPQDFEGWATLVAFISLEDSKSYQLYVETQPRLGDNWQRMATALIRTAIVYNPKPSLSLFAGYGWFPSFYDADYHRSYRDEQRLWQQILYRQELWGITWHHRLRQEERWIEHTDEVSYRTRYMLRGSLELNDARDFGITAFDEVMVNLNAVADGPWSGYDRNRIFFGPFWEFGAARYEVGYLGEHAERFGDDERWVNAIAATAILNF
jgi:hypothetical protein